MEKVVAFILGGESVADERATDFREAVEKDATAVWLPLP